MFKPDFGFFLGLGTVLVAMMLARIYISKLLNNFLLLRSSSASPLLEKLPYRKADSLLSPAERSFYEVLLRVSCTDMHVFPKVRLLDLLWLPPQMKERQVYLNRVQSKHLDFVLCDRTRVEPLLAIELDDASHQMLERQARDQFVDAVLKAAGLSLLRVPVQRSYSPCDLAILIEKELHRGETVRAKVAAAQT